MIRWWKLYSARRSVCWQPELGLRILISTVDYFDAQAPANPRFGNASNANNDDAILAQFQADYYESIEEAQRHNRKPATATGGKGAKEAPKGPKLGGSKSIRAKMRLAEEQAAQAAKAKR